VCNTQTTPCKYGVAPTKHNFRSCVTLNDAGISHECKMMSNLKSILNRCKPRERTHVDRNSGQKYECQICKCCFFGICSKQAR
jgi:hypothetical protein